jgi:hypothetical protein
MCSLITANLSEPNTILACDPGPVQSAFVLYRKGEVLAHQILPNEEARLLPFETRGRFAIEQVESYGMPVGRDIFDTVEWCGRFIERASQAGVQVSRVPRKVVKLWICGTSRAKDTNIRAALVDKYGGRTRAIGTKALPGPLYGIKTHLWSALAVAVTAELLRDEHGPNGAASGGDPATGGCRLRGSEDAVHYGHPGG